MNIQTVSPDYLAWFLAGFYLFVGVFYFSIIKFRQTKEQAKQLVHAGQRYSLHWWNHLSFRVFRVSILCVCVARVISPSIDQYLGLFTLPNEFYFNLVGVSALISGFCLAIISNLSLNEAWRSGIDSSQLSLSTKGVYAMSRNPGYIGVGVAQIGFFFALPSVFSLVCMLVGLNALRLQTNLEEAFLSLMHPVKYGLYCKQVPKWI